MCEELCDDTGGAFDAFAVPAPNGSTLDPSGLVKGWSIELAAGILTNHGHTDFTINAGGDIAIRGQAAPGTPWSIGIRHPDDRDRLAMVLEASVRRRWRRRRPTSVGRTSSTRGSAGRRRNSRV